MATLHPFRALRPRHADAARIAAVPYDVVSIDEARALAEGNPLSFLRVSRAEIELPPGTDQYGDAVYQRAVRNFEHLKKEALLLEDEPSVYVYRLRRGRHKQTGIAACYSIDEYDRNIIKKHERTRRDKEDDRTRHLIALGAQTGPVFLLHPASGEVDEVSSRVTAGAPLFDFETADHVRHTLWRVVGSARKALVAAFGSIPALYIADGHHRAASAARARADIRDGGITRSSLGDGADYRTFLGVAFPHDQVQILAYNRVVQDLGELEPYDFLQAVRDRFELEAGPATPARRGDIAMYFKGGWHRLRPRLASVASPAVDSLDVSMLQDRLLRPVLRIADVRADKRINFIAGARGARELEELVDSGTAAVAFSMYPVGVADLMAIADAGAIMPPKSTWFEPKLRDGLLMHVI